VTKLYVTSGLKEETVFEIEKDVTTLGRSPDSDLVIQDPSVSRRHAKIFRRRDRFFIEDLGSSNGTWINGQLSTSGSEYELKQGLPVAVGNTILSLAEKPPSDVSTTRYSINLMECGPEAVGSGSYRERFLSDRRRLEIIQETSTSLMQSLDAQEICEKVMDALFHSLQKIDAGLILWRQAEEDEPVEILARSRDRKRTGRVRYSKSVVTQALRQGEAIMMAETGLDEREDLSASIGIMHLRSIMCVPLISKARIRGVLYVHSTSQGQKFQMEDLLLFTALGTPAAMALENAHLYSETKRAEEALHKAHDELEERVRQRTMELSAANERLTREIRERRKAEEALAGARAQEVEVAARIQKSLLLGSIPAGLPGLQIAALSVPSKGIDGDFYDFFTHSETCLDLIIGDVMGKGIPAALLGAGTKNHFFRALTRLITASRHLPEPRAILQRTHDRIVKELIGLESFVTLCYARFDLSRRVVDFVDCGHPGTIHFQSSTGTCSVLKGRNIPLGFAPEEVYEQESAVFEPLDLFVFYSDGITEAASTEGELFGEARLMQCILSNGRIHPEKLLSKIRSEVTDFSGSDSFLDDLTCVVVKIAGGSEQTSVQHEEVEINSDLKDLEKASRFARDFVQKRISPPLSEERSWQFEIAVNEAVANIIKHAYEGASGGRIRIVADAFPDRVEVRLHHWGHAFDGTAASPPKLDGTEESGYGLFLMDQSLDRVAYSTGEHGKSTISLVKFRRDS
jgi:phosphoserine phosphatase RsbU/P